MPQKIGFGIMPRWNGDGMVAFVTILMQNVFCAVSLVVSLNKWGEIRGWTFWLACQNSLKHKLELYSFQVAILD
jgi:hypothetical protein